MSLFDTARNLLTKRANGTPSMGTSGRGKALITGSVAVGALITGAVLEKARRTRLPQPTDLPRALDADVHDMEIMEGRARYYKRAGVGVPIVLLHSINAAASSYEMKPLFDHLKATTSRPLYALEWLGFGLSDRPAVRYSPGLYQRQLRRFLSEHVREASDIIALSLACEYAATVANAFPVLVNRLVFISPTGTGHSEQDSLLQKAAVGLASSMGAFEVFYSKLTQRESLGRFYAEHVFRDPERVPNGLVDYARHTTQVNGAHHAPRRFIQGVLSMHEYAPKSYVNLEAPTLFVVPEMPDDSVQDFARVTDIVEANPGIIRLEELDSGLLPQWETPDQLFRLVDAFLDVEAEMPSQPVS